MRAAVVLLLVIPALVLLSGCATGVRMTDEEVIACRNDGCSAWTEAELTDLVRRAAAEGYARGWTDATRQSSRGL